MVKSEEFMAKKNIVKKLNDSKQVKEFERNSKKKLGKANSNKFPK